MKFADKVGGTVNEGENHRAGNTGWTLKTNHNFIMFSNTKYQFVSSRTNNRISTKSWELSRWKQRRRKTWLY